MNDKYANFNPKNLNFCPYEILGLSYQDYSEAFKKLVQKSYRKMALKYHPDRHPDDEQKHKVFIQIKEASEILSNNVTKKLYDEVLNARKLNQERINQQSAKRRDVVKELIRREQEVLQKEQEKQTKPKKQESEFEKIVRETKEAEKLEREREYQIDSQLRKVAKQTKTYSQVFVQLKPNKFSKSQGMIFTEQILSKVLDQKILEGFILQLDSENDLKNHSILRYFDLKILDNFEPKNKPKVTEPIFNESLEDMLKNI